MTRNRAGVERSEDAALAPVITSSPPVNRLWVAVFPASRLLAGTTRAAISGTISKNGSIRVPDVEEAAQVLVHFGLA